MHTQQERLIKPATHQRILTLDEIRVLKIIYLTNAMPYSPQARATVSRLVADDLVEQTNRNGRPYLALGEATKQAVIADIMLRNQN
jgi:hypothetical protein